MVGETVMSAGGRAMLIAELIERAEAKVEYYAGARQ
jgi:hypothetical protein